MRSNPRVQRTACLLALFWVLPSMAHAQSPSFITTWGSLGNGLGEFSSPAGIALGTSGIVYVVDESNVRVQEFLSSGAFMIAWGNFGVSAGRFKIGRAHV